MHMADNGKGHQMIPFTSGQMYLLVLANQLASSFHKHLVLSSIMSIESNIE